MDANLEKFTYSCQLDQRRAPAAKLGELSFEGQRLPLEAQAGPAISLLANSTVHALGDSSFDFGVLAFIVADVALLLSGLSLYLVWKTIRAKPYGGGRRGSASWMPRVVDVPVSEGGSGTELVSSGANARRLSYPMVGVNSMGVSSEAMVRFFSFNEEKTPRGSVGTPRGGEGEYVRRMTSHLEQFHGVAFIPEEDEADGDSPSKAQTPVNFNGLWECVETWGLDDFLQRMGVGRIRRLAALKAPWPTWQFCQVGNEFTYINKSKFGVMTEVFIADGPEYTHKDLEGNATTCKAFWQDGSLVIERMGPQGMCREMRTVKNGDELDFVLQVESLNCSWGRRFIRKRDG